MKSNELPACCRTFSVGTILLQVGTILLQDLRLQTLKSLDWELKRLYCSEIWEAARQQSCRSNIRASEQLWIHISRLRNFIGWGNGLFRLIGAMSLPEPIFDLLSIKQLRTNCSEIFYQIQFSFKKINWKTSSAKWRPFCFSLNVLRWTCPGEV